MNQKLTHQELKEKTFRVCREMEADGWDLIALDLWVTKTKKDYQPAHVTYFAVLIKDDIHVYIEFECESRTWLKDIKLHCPKCGRMQYDGSYEEGGDFCPDCETPFEYKKEIMGEYYQ